MWRLSVSTKCCGVVMFTYEKLHVYQAAKRFSVMRIEMLTGISRKVAASEQLERASESIVLNIAHASAAWGARERSQSIGHANGSALESAACLDILAEKSLLSDEFIHQPKELLSEIVAMLIGWKKKTEMRVKEHQPIYGTSKRRLFFAHEALDVYRAALEMTGWIDGLSDLECSSDLFSKLDKSTTSIVLNIAEGNGRFAKADKIRFLKIAHKATIQSSSLVYLALSTKSPPLAKMGSKQFERILMMLNALMKSVA